MPVIEFANINDFDEDKIWLAFPVFAQKSFVRLEKGDSAQEEWDFLSWIDAIGNSAITYQTLEFFHESSGKLSFEQSSWPSGGLEATEELIKVFGGTIRSNNAI